MNIAQQIVNGLVLGSGYACIALGWTILLGVARLVNFAHGQLYMLGAFATWYAMTRLGHAISPGHSCCDRRACDPGRTDAERNDGSGHDPEPDQPDDRDARPRLCAARRQCADFWRQSADAYRAHLHAPKSICGSLWFTWQDVLVLAATLALYGAVWLFTQKTRFGSVIRAVAEDPKLAELFGINAKVVYLLVFVFECSAVALGAALVAPRSPILTSMGFNEVIMTFVVVVLGGIGSIGGALAAGLGLGLFIAFFGAFVAHAYTTAAAFAVLLALLVIRPAGLATK